ncbi:MAG: DUF4198 domain-containing protein [Pseudomonadota bacterium]
MRNLIVILSAGATLLLSGAAQAHTSYILPSYFNTTRGELVTLQSAFTEAFFAPEIAVNAADFHVLGPDGARDEIDDVSTHSQLVLMEEALDEDGTYRFTTGVRRGRISKRVLVEGEWRSIFSDAEIPADAAEIVTRQTETVAEAYVSKGAPNWAAAERTIGLLAFAPETHPSEVYMDEGFEMRVYFDGAPLADHEISLYRGGGHYESPKFKQSAKTDKEGRVSFDFDAAGVYLVMTRRRADAPPGAETDERSYTTSLTFEVLR